MEGRKVLNKTVLKMNGTILLDNYLKKKEPSPVEYGNSLNRLFSDTFLHRVKIFESSHTRRKAL